MGDPEPSHEGQEGDHYEKVTDARLRSYDGLPLTIPEVEGEIGWGATPMFATPLFVGQCSSLFFGQRSSSLFSCLTARCFALFFATPT